MTIKTAYRLLSIFCITTIITACSSDNNTPNVVTPPTFSVSSLLTDEVNQQILPAVSNFVTATTNFNNSILTYTTAPTETNLEAARALWKTAAIAYEKTYVFYIGELRDQFIHLAIYKWPTTTTAVENNIADNTITQSFMDNLSPNSKSFAALEYLLYKSDISTTNSEFVADSNRLEYLKLSGAFLLSQANRMQTIWDGYANTFINNTGTGLQNSFNMFFNAIHNMIDTAKITKIGKPAGLENTQIINPEKTQAFFSDTSIAIVRANMESLANDYFNPEGLGINDYVMFVTGSNTLNERVQMRIDAVNNALDALNGPLDQAISTQNQDVETLHTALENLRVTFAVDLQSILSIIITTTDVDGD